MSDGTIGISGTKLTEVRSGPMRADGTSAIAGKVVNEYTEGRHKVLNTRHRQLRDGFSKGIDLPWLKPTFATLNTDIPKMTPLSGEMLIELDNNGPQKVEDLAEMFGSTVVKINNLIKKLGFDIVYINKNKATLMAEGRRIAALLQEEEEEVDAKGTGHTD